ncbi:MAG TPA: TetR/AcrR family transcriptional regulator [Solimonas sp.]|nr:TetR/AcrR family transcriptional regulator [Solimonas sp.]
MTATKTPARKPRIRNPALTRARLLQATVEILAQKGAEGLSIKEAARLAKVSRGVAYQHFEHREHLLSEAKGWITERIVESMQTIGSTTPDGLLLHMARLILQNRDAATLLITDAIAGRDLSLDHPLNRLVVVSLQQMKNRGEARADIDIEVLSFIFLGMVSTLVMLSRVPGSDTEALAQRFTHEFSSFMRQGIYEQAAQGALRV